jgi:hypothetical protein
VGTVKLLTRTDRHVHAPGESAVQYTKLLKLLCDLFGGTTILMLGLERRSRHDFIRDWKAA